MEPFGLFTSYIALLAPIAFVFAIGAYTMAAKQKKEIDTLKKELKKIKDNKDE